MKSSKEQKMTIERLRELLDAYYDGSSAAATEDELIRHFTSNNDIPEEFAADAAIFRAMADLRIKSADVPPTLEKRILEATVGNVRPRRFKLMLRIASVAAAVALIVGIGLRIGHDDRLPADSPVHTPSELVAKAVEPIRQDTACIAETVVAEKPAKAVAHAARPKPVKVKAKTGNGYQIVTDTVQALEIADRALALLGASLDAGAEGMRKAEVASVNFDNTIEAIYMSYN